MKREEGKTDQERKRGRVRRERQREREETDRSSLTAMSNRNKQTRVNCTEEVRVLQEEGEGTDSVLRRGHGGAQRADQPESHGLPKSQHTPCIGKNLQSKRGGGSSEQKEVPKGSNST